MDEDTFRSRLMKLMQKSRQAFRLYDSVGRGAGESSEFTEMQAAEWRLVNASLIKQLALALEHPNSRALASQIFLLRKQFWEDYRTSEAELKQRQQELVIGAEAGDFVRAASLSRGLVSLKARMQAAQAAHHELDDLIQKSKLVAPPITLSDVQVVHDERIDAERISQSGMMGARAENSEAFSAPRVLRAVAGQRGAKIIPLRKKI